MQNNIELTYKDKTVKTLSVVIVENKANYINTDDLFENTGRTTEAIMILNKVVSIQVQLDLQNAPQLFVISFNDDGSKQGVSINYLQSSSPFSMLLQEKTYLIVPYSKALTPQSIVGMLIKEKQ